MEITDRSVPPGFRFHPTEEELVEYYLLRKIKCQKIDLDVIVDIDLYKMEPWEIEDKCKLGYEEQNEWYFFSHKDKKYPTGSRTNRATKAGFWKATGRDKVVVSKNKIIGMRKTLVFYKGRASNGRKSNWIMHEYRLQTSQHTPPQEGWVVCRAFKKPTPSTNRPYRYDPCWHMMNSRSSAATTTTHVIAPSPLPDLIESNYNHPAATTMTALHDYHQPLPAVAAFTSFHDYLHMGPTNCSLDSNYSQQAFESTTVNEGDGGLFENYKSGHNWKFINSLLASDDEYISSNQAPSCFDDLISSQLDGNIINPGYDQLSTADQDDQVAHFLTCFTNL